MKPSVAEDQSREQHIFTSKIYESYLNNLQESREKKQTSVSLEPLLLLIISGKFLDKLKSDIRNKFLIKIIWL